MIIVDLFIGYLGLTAGLVILCAIVGFIKGFLENPAG